MSFNEIMENIKSLAQSQGSYARLYNAILELESEKLQELKETWENKNFKDSGFYTIFRGLENKGVFKMELKKVITKNGKEYIIVNEFINTRNGFAHKSTLTKNGYEIESHRVNYLNRTWECYRYETSMRGLINKIMESEQVCYITQYKNNNGILRLKKGQKEQIIKEWQKGAYIQDLMEIKERINDRNFD